MAVITFTSDWNKQDYYSGMLKGRILRMIPSASLVDISHDIQPFHSIQGAFVLRHALTEFPMGTIHVLLVNQGFSGDVNPVICKYRGQYILSWNDPVLGLLFDEEPEFCLQITPDIFSKMDLKDPDISGTNDFSPAFPEMALFPNIIKWLIEKQDLVFEGQESIPIGQSPWQPVIQGGAITGRVIYIDSYKNAISNISRSLFDSMKQEGGFGIFVKSNHYKIEELSANYRDAEPGDLIALFNSVGFLEIAIIQGRVGELLSLEPGSTIKVKFYGQSK